MTGWGPSINRPRGNTLFSPSLFSGSIAELLHPPAGQIPFLDGLRSIAVLLVISGHLSHQFAEINGQTSYSKLPFVANGWIGVDLFFVLSGFFIGGQLWKELKASNSIHVGRFIVRRGFRIWPLYFFTFLCVLLYYGHSASAKEFGWSDLVFITNFYNRGLVLGSWSLCTEEQFYIVTPLALFFFARRLRLIQDFRPWLWGLLLAVPMLRIVVWVHLTGHFFAHNPQLFSPIFFSSATHCDGLIVGLIIANLWASRETRIIGISNPWLLIALACVSMAILHVFQKEIFDFSVLALFFGSFVWLGIQRTTSLFNSRVFYWLSRLSYGMYLNHEYMCPWIVNTILPRLPFATSSRLISNLIGVVIVVVFSVGISLVTFCLVEHPFLQMRKIVLRRQPKPASSDFAPVSR